MSVEVVAVLFAVVFVKDEEDDVAGADGAGDDLIHWENGVG